MQKLVLKNSLTKQIDLESYPPYVMCRKNDYSDDGDFEDVSVTLTWNGTKYTASSLYIFSSGQSLPNPYTSPLNGVKYTLGSNTTDYFLQVEIPDDCFLFAYNSFHLDTSSFSMPPNFTLAPALVTAVQDIQQNFLFHTAGNKQSLTDVIATINAAYSDSLAKEALQTPLVVSNLSIFLNTLKVFAETLNTTPVPTSGVASGVVDAYNLNGSLCKYINGQVVYYGTYGLWVVERAFLMLTADNQLTPTYDLVKNEEGNIRRCTVPQDYVFPFIAASS